MPYAAGVVGGSNHLPVRGFVTWRTWCGGTPTAYWSTFRDPQRSRPLGKRACLVLIATVDNCAWRAR